MTRRDDLKAATKKQLDQLRHSVRKDPHHAVNVLLAGKVPRVPAVVKKYCDKQEQYNALTKQIEELTKQRSLIASALGEMATCATNAQRKAIRAEWIRRGHDV